jgi:pimeloyl-ACP methyl ester carboxylesterase
VATDTTTIDLDHVRLSALTWGPSDGPLALLLHGFPDSAHTWRHLGPVLAEEGWRVVAPFTRGYAPSSVPGDGRSDVGALMDDAAGVHQALGGDDSAVLVGHDWGAITANGLAAHRDSPFRRIVSMSVPPLNALPLRETVRHLPRQARRSWYVAFNQLPLWPERSMERLVTKLWRDWSPAYDATADVASTLAALPDTAHRRAAVDYYRQIARPVGVPRRYRHWQAALSGPALVPVLYLHGRDDGCMTASFAEIAQSHVPPETEVRMVDDAGHFLHLEQPAEVNRQVRDFLAAVGP